MQSSFTNAALTNNNQLYCFPSRWVGYSEPGFEGQQHILEEGEFLDCSDWGGSEPLLSLRPILSVSAAPRRLIVCFLYRQP